MEKQKTLNEMLDKIEAIGEEGRTETLSAIQNALRDFAELRNNAVIADKETVEMIEEHENEIKRLTELKRQIKENLHTIHQKVDGLVRTAEIFIERQ